LLQQLWLVLDADDRLIALDVYCAVGLELDFSALRSLSVKSRSQH
jgi:hypothetical protein